MSRTAAFNTGVAARLEALAEPGGIRISRAVFNNVKGKLDLGFSDLGLQKVKNIAEPIPTYQVLLDPEDVGKFIYAKAKSSSGKNLHGRDDNADLSTIACLHLMIELFIFAWRAFYTVSNECFGLCPAVFPTK